MNSFLILEAANLRKEPSVNSEKVGLLSSGVVVHFTETIASDNRVWIRISEYNAWTVEENGYHLPDNYKENDFIMFGPESRGIPEDLLNKFKDNNITIPMLPIGRSLNLSNSVAIILYESLRQQGFNY